jgi:hypothetical protein
MSTTTETRKIPAPIYAAAGAGDLAYQELRKLPAKVAGLRGRVAELRPTVTETISQTPRRVDMDKLRGAALRNAQAVVVGAQAVVVGAQAAQERAQAVYADLVTRGERVVRSARSETADDIKIVAEVVEPNSARGLDGELPSVPNKVTKRARPTATGR